MAVAVVNASVESVDVIIPGKKSDVWYQIDNESWKPYRGGSTEHIPVDIKTVSSTKSYILLLYNLINHFLVFCNVCLINLYFSLPYFIVEEA